jgi:endonuclease YncB( thermonuclease family)
MQIQTSSVVRRVIAAILLVACGMYVAGVVFAEAEKVYVTRTGKKYHRASCSSLRSSKIEMPLAEAAARYGACGICRPPVPTNSSQTAPVEDLATAPKDLARAPSTQDRFVGKVVGVLDGDTISVMRNGRSVRVRLEGIDCPERGQDFSQRAKQFTSDKTFGNDATILVRDIDRYGRLVARVHVNGEDISLSLVQVGLAWHYTKYSSDPALAAAEKAARAARLGLWSHSNAVPPWEFRSVSLFGGYSHV